MKTLEHIQATITGALRALFRLLRVRPEERVLAIVGTLWFGLLNAWTIVKYFPQFSKIATNYHKVFVGPFYESGFDPLTYVAVSDWSLVYDVHRHPLLALFCYPLYLINRLLMSLTGMNWATILVGLMVTLCAVYALLFAYRILREIIGLGRGDALLFSAYLFSMGYIMLSCMVPDHFVLSLMMILLSLYVTGLHLRQRRPMGGVATVALFIVTAGITLSNGLKTFIMALFANGRRFFRPRFLLGAVVVPALLIWLCAEGEERAWIEPQQQAFSQAKKAQDDSIRQAMWQQVVRQNPGKDSAAIARKVHAVIQNRIHAKYVHDHQQAWNLHKGKPMGQGTFASWTDGSTPRWPSLVENVFGESIQIHADHCLQDVLRDRPVIVRYRSPLPYAVEAIIVALFVAGVVASRRSRWLWMILACTVPDILIHLGLGFGLNEVYIMAGHWLWSIPLSTACLMRRQGSLRWALRVLVLVLTVYLSVSNAYLILSH
jgi:hypothetical protein